MKVGVLGAFVGGSRYPSRLTLARAGSAAEGGAEVEERARRLASPRLGESTVRHATASLRHGGSTTRRVFGPPRLASPRRVYGPPRRIYDTASLRHGGSTTRRICDSTWRVNCSVGRLGGWAVGRLVGRVGGPRKRDEGGTSRQHYRGRLGSDGSMCGVSCLVMLGQRARIENTETILKRASWLAK